MSTTITGNITTDPELRYTSNGTAVCNVTIATTPRTYDKATQEWVDGDTLFLRCTTWGTQAENMTEKLVKGARVIATGTLEQHRYTDADGIERISIELSVDEIGPSLRFATKNDTTTVRRSVQKSPARVTNKAASTKPSDRGSATGLADASRTGSSRTYARSTR